MASVILVVVAAGACKVESKAPSADTTGAADPAVTSSAQVGTSSVVGARIAVAHAGPPGEWQMPAGDYASSRYSELGTITPQNVANLHVSWAFSTGVLRGHEGQPLVVGNTMYVVTPYPNVSYAIDLAQTGQPLKWKFRPENAQQAIGRACCDVVNRGAAYAGAAIVADKSKTAEAVFQNRSMFIVVSSDK
jgi:glucose dehydrogenase